MNSITDQCTFSIFKIQDIILFQYIFLIPFYPKMRKSKNAYNIQKLNLLFNKTHLTIPNIVQAIVSILSVNFFK